jgi:site-specific DNA-methyltransferase (adenine-specific)
LLETEHSVIYFGSNLDVLPKLEDNSVDSIVTDPPYELGFMGKKWDSSGIAYNVELWKECLRVLKPGGHLLSFGGTRTWHRVAVAIEDAGFEVRDSIAWMYGSGFPKSLDISKAIDKAAGAEREVLTETVDDLFGERTEEKETTDRRDDGTTYGLGHSGKVVSQEAITPEAQQWEGWGTALKPAFEPIVVARKPLTGTVAQNVLEHGTGGLNIDGSRIGRAEGDNSSAGNRTATFGNQDTQSGGDGSGGWEQNSGGRWPANVILDEYSAEILDEQSGVSKSQGGNRKVDRSPFQTGEGEYEPVEAYGDTGGASRFFYCPKASKTDRNEGLEELEAQRHSDREKDDGVGGDNPRNRTNNARQNFHPTVKPTALMTYLVNLVTPPNGTVLDPFTGSGSTGKAAIMAGFNFVGIELTEEYYPIIEGRLKHAEAKLTENKDKEGEQLF